MGSSGQNLKRNSNVLLEVSRFQMKLKLRGWSQRREDEESQHKPWMRCKSRIILSAELLPTNEKNIEKFSRYFNQIVNLCFTHFHLIFSIQTSVSLRQFLQPPSILRKDLFCIWEGCYFVSRFV